MKFNLQKLQENKLYTYSLDDTWVNDLINEINTNESYNINELNITLSFIKPSDDPNTFLVNLNASSKVVTQCSYCLSDFIYNLNETQHYTCVNKNLICTTSNQIDLDSDNLKDDDDIITLPNYYLDISSLTRETFLLGKPYVFKCNELCHGMCLHCGTNLNNDKCNCSNKKDFINDKFAVLKDLNSGG